MKRIELEQRSAAWHAWRNGGIGGSEIGVLLKYAEVLLAHAKKLKHPLADSAAEIREQVAKVKEPKTYDKTLYSLWAERQGLIPPISTNEHMERGIRWEDQIRLEFENEHGFFGGPECGEMEHLPFARVSFDWRGNDHKNKPICAEFKAPSWFSLVAMRKHGLPGQYLCQTQYQLGISGDAYCIFYARYIRELHDEEGNVVEGDFDARPFVQKIERDELLIGTLLALVNFYGETYIVGQEPPPFCKEDKIFIPENSIEELATRNQLMRYQELEVERLELEELIKEPKARLKAIEAEQAAIGEGVAEALPKAGTVTIAGGVDITRTSRKGTVDWGNAWQSRGYDAKEADYYRKPLSTGFKIVISGDAIAATKERMALRAEQEVAEATPVFDEVTNTEEV